MNMPMDRRTAFLEEMGLDPLWKLRNAPDTQADEPVEETPAVAKASAPATAPAPMPIPPAKSVRMAESAWSDAPAVGEASVVALAPKPVPVDSVTSTEEGIATMDMAQLKAAVASCTRCGLCKGRTKTVFGVGDEQAEWLFIGEGPGRNEDRQGEPFVGPAGKLLDNMMAAMALKRGANAYIANVVKCRPTGPDGRDRPPTQEEAAACAPYLQRQIDLIQPSIMIALGKSAAVSLLKLDPKVAVSALRGKLHRYNGLPLVVTYHPAYLLRQPVDKRKSWADLSLAMQTHATPAE